jgi:hypothetical protein
LILDLRSFGAWLQLLLQRVSTRLLGRGRMSHLVKHLLHGM